MSERAPGNAVGYRCLLLAIVLGTAQLPASAQTATSDAAAPRAEVELLPVVPPDLTHLEPAVATQLEEAASLLETLRQKEGAEPAELAEAFGSTGRLYHAYDLDEPAATCYENARRLAPDDFRWIYSLAFLDRKAGRFERAIEGFERALELDPASLPAWVRLGDCQLSLGRLEPARASLERALELDPESAAARSTLGQVALSEKDYAAAVEHLQAALESVPAASRLHHPLGLAYRGLGDLEKARHHLGLRGGVGVQPPDPLIASLAELKVGERVFLLRGRLAFNNGMYREAVKAFSAAVEAAPESVRARVNLGSALAQDGRQAEAVAIYREVLELEPENKTAHYNLGTLLLHGGDPQGGVEALAAAARFDPLDVEARVQLASALARLGRPEEALGYAREAQAIDPAHVGVRVLETRILLSLRRYGEAKARIEEAHELMPEAGTVALVLARILAASPDLEQRDGARALDLAQRIYQAVPNVQHAELVALALAEAGRCDEAEKVQTRAVEAARKAQAGDLLARLEATLARLGERPCRVPAGANGDAAASDLP